jgi:Fic family protein
MAARGLARNRDEYRAALAEADAPRHGDFDGRGALSQRGLADFCDFFLSTCLDQIRYMRQLLDVDGLAERVESYGRARELGALPNRDGSTAKPHRFRKETTRLVRDLIYRGSIKRGEIPELLGLEERTARRVVEALTKDGFISSASSRAPVDLRIPTHAAPYWFPELYAPRT